MRTAEETKQIVKDKYGEIAMQPDKSCCGGPEDSCGLNYVIMADEYTALSGYVAEADLGLGCGLPTESARLQPGETVLDLGSGAGNDVFVAQSLVGESGHVIGVDMTPAMVEKARANATKIGVQNVEFRLGDIEKLPVERNSIDVVLSNCVLNLVPDKRRAFAEIYRVLKVGGRFCISDIVVTDVLPSALRADAELHVGCVAGALPQAEYLGIIAGQGFSKVRITKQKAVSLPPEILQKHLSPAEVATFKSPIISITVVAEKE